MQLLTKTKTKKKWKEWKRKEKQKVNEEWRMDRKPSPLELMLDN